MADELSALVAEVPLMPLGPGRPIEEYRVRLQALEAPAAVRAGLWLAFDFLDESHRISQDLGSPEGSFWHAIMHRREPDAWNSKYWWRRVGPHPVLEQLRERSSEAGYSFTSPEAFVDFCERVRGTRGADEEAARRVQRLEWDCLFAWCFERAVSK